MALAGAPASDLAVQPPAASTEAVDVTAGATIREDPGPAAATAAAAAFFHVLSFLLMWSYISGISCVRTLFIVYRVGSYTAIMSCLHCCTLHESVAVLFRGKKWMDVNMNTIIYYWTASSDPGFAWVLRSWTAGPLYPWAGLPLNDKATKPAKYVKKE